MSEFVFIKKKFEDELGVKIFERTRKREVVEARAVFYYYLHKFKKLGLVEITRLVEQHTGYKPNHATIHHAKEKYDIYAKYNLRLDDALRNVVGHFNSTNDKQRYIKSKIDRLPNNIIDDIYKTVEIEYTKVLLEN